MSSLPFIERITAALRAIDYVPLQRPRKAAKANGHTPPPGDLVAPGIGQVVEALRHLPIRSTDPREYWVAMAHAVVAATAKSEEGRAAWLDWCAQYSTDPKSTDNADRLWQGIDPAQCHVGYRWLVQQAWEESKGRCTLIYDFDFDHDDDEEPQEPPPVDLVAPAAPDFEAIGGMVDLLTSDCTIEDWTAIIGVMAHTPLMPGQADALLRRIKAATGVDLKTLRKQLTYEQMKLSATQVYDVPYRLAKAIQGLYGIGKLAYHNGDWLRYSGKSWAKIDANALAKEMQAVALDQPALMMSVGDARPQNVNTAVTQAMGLLEAEVHDRLAPLLRPEMATRPILNLANGTILISTVDGAVTFKPHDPDDLLTYCCDVDYDPTATCPRFDKALADIVSETYYTVRPGDQDYAETANRLTLGDAAVRQGPGRMLYVYDQADNERMLLETMGYALTPWREARCYLIWKGNGHNGKSRLMMTVRAMLPPGTVQASRIENLKTDRFSLSELDGKLLFLDDDMNYQAELPDGPLKMISEAKQVTAPKKYAGDIAFNCCTFPVILCNSWPSTADLSDATRDRALVMEFRRVYKREERHLSPWSSIWSDRREMSGILNRMLSALSGVIKRGYILPSRAGVDAHATWVSNNAPEVEFIHAVCTRVAPAGGNNGDTANDLYSAFRSYYATHFGDTRYLHGIARFRSVLEQMGFETYRTGKYRHRVRGLWLRDDRVERGIGVSYLDPTGDEGDDD